MIQGHIETDILDERRQPVVQARMPFVIHENDHMSRLMKAALEEKARQIGLATTNRTSVKETRIVITV